MLQRKSCLAASLILAMLAGRDDRLGSAAAQVPPAPASTQPAARIVSLSPAATDLVLAMGAGSQLVGVSNYDNDPRVADLPRVGDYLNVDWERIAVLAPDHMLLQVAPERLPSGFQARADELKLTLHNVKIDRFEDITREAEAIGAAIGQGEAGTRLSATLTLPLTVLRLQVEGRPRVRTLIALSEDGLTVAGPGTFLDDLLVAAGGENAMGNDRPGYSQIDRELVLSLAPDAIVQLAPLATPAQLEANRAAWNALATLPAVEHGRVLVVTEPWAMMPGSHMTDLARRIAAHLHPDAVTP